MTGTQLDLLDEQNELNEVGPQEGSTEGSNSTPPAHDSLAPKPTAELDFKALYQQSLAERMRMQAELERVSSVVQRPVHAEEDERVTDEDFEKLGTAGAMQKLIRLELKKQGQPIEEISQEFKRGKAMDAAERAFFSSNPQVAQWKDALAPLVRDQLANAPNITPFEYSRTAWATIGFMSANHPVVNTPVNDPTPTPAPTPPRQNAPISRVQGNPAPRASAPRLGELERTGMRKIGLDPNKIEDVQKFLAMVNDESGVSI